MVKNTENTNKTNLPNTAQLSMQRALLRRLLQKNARPLQVGAAIGAAWLGLVLTILALQSYFDVQKVLDNTDSRSDFLTINKKVNFLNTLGASSAFSEKEVKNFEKQAFIKAAAPFVANQFRLIASSSAMGFQTELFFEAVPDSFVDVNKDRFRWEVGDTEVPMVLSKDYLALYNFGFAPSQGLPQFTANTIRQVSFDLIIIGEGGRSTTIKGRIVDFSDRINSILVPTTFLSWANTEYGKKQPAPPSKLLLSVANANDQRLDDFLYENGYEMSSGKLLGTELKATLRLAMLALVSLGGLLLLLSLIILVQNYQIIIAGSAKEVQLLLQLGYQSAALSYLLRSHLSRLLWVLVMLLIIAFGAIRWMIFRWVTAQGFDLNALPNWITTAVLASLLLLFYTIGQFDIGRSVRKIENA